MRGLRHGVALSLLLGLSGCAGLAHRHHQHAAPASRIVPEGPAKPAIEALPREAPVDAFSAQPAEATERKGLLARYFPRMPWRTPAAQKAIEPRMPLFFRQRTQPPPTPEQLSAMGFRHPSAKLRLSSQGPLTPSLPVTLTLQAHPEKAPIANTLVTESPELQSFSETATAIEQPGAKLTATVHTEAPEESPQTEPVATAAIEPKPAAQPIVEPVATAAIEPKPAAEPIVEPVATAAIEPKPAAEPIVEQVATGSGPVGPTLMLPQREPRDVDTRKAQAELPELASPTTAGPTASGPDQPHPELLAAGPGLEPVVETEPAVVTEPAPAQPQPPVSNPGLARSEAKIRGLDDAVVKVKLNLAGTATPARDAVNPGAMTEPAGPALESPPQAVAARATVAPREGPVEVEGTTPVAATSPTVRHSPAAHARSASLWRPTYRPQGLPAIEFPRAYYFGSAKIQKNEPLLDPEPRYWTGRLARRVRSWVGGG